VFRRSGANCEEDDGGWEQEGKVEDVFMAALLP